MTKKEKVWAIIESILAGNNSDKEIMESTGLKEQDLNDCYSSAELVITKARNELEGQEFKAACRSWLDFYDWS